MTTGPGGDLTPSLNIAIKPAARTRFPHLEGSSSVIYSVHNGCALDRTFDARWAAATVLTIAYPECSPGPYRSPGDDTVIVKDTQWGDIAIDYQITK